MNPPEGPDITLISVHVDSITLVDGTVIDRSWLEAHDWADAVDYYIWDVIEWDNEIIDQLCEEAACSE